MTKIAMMGQIHEDGWKILKQKNYDVFEITDFSKENLIKTTKRCRCCWLFEQPTLNKDVILNTVQKLKLFQDMVLVMIMLI